MSSQHASQLFTVELQLVREVDEYFYFSNILTALKKGAEDSFVIVVEATHRRGPLHCLVCQTRSRLHRWQPHRDTKPFRQRIHAITPHTGQVFSARIERRHWLRSQLKSSPD